MKINEITEGVFSNLAKHYGGEENYNATSKWAAPLAAKGKDWVKLEKDAIIDAYTQGNWEIIEGDALEYYNNTFTNQ